VSQQWKKRNRTTRKIMQREIRLNVNYYKDKQTRSENNFYVYNTDETEILESPEEAKRKILHNIKPLMTIKIDIYQE
jgi:hypothetical protein